MDDERKDWIAGFLGEQNGSRLSRVARSFWAVDRETHGKPPIHAANHLNKPSCTAASRRAANGSVTKALNKTSNVFAIEALRGKKHDASPAKIIGAEKNPIVPNGVNGQFTVSFYRFEVLFTLRFKSNR